MQIDPVVLSGALADIDALEKTLDWQPFREGIEIARIYRDGEAGPSAAFLRYAPGARVAYHFHPGFEHIVILKGTQRDRLGEHGPGTLIINPPGTSHAVSSPGGCIVLIIWEKPVVIAPAEPPPR